MSSMKCVQAFGGDKLRMIGRFNGKAGENYLWDLRYFNLTMLAKQGLRMLHDQDSLLFQCFKARYFPWCHFLDAIKPPNNSYVWKSIMAVMPI